MKFFESVKSYIAKDRPKEMRDITINKLTIAGGVFILTVFAFFFFEIRQIAAIGFLMTLFFIAQALEIDYAAATGKWIRVSGYVVDTLLPSLLLRASDNGAIYVIHDEKTGKDYAIALHGRKTARKVNLKQIRLEKSEDSYVEAYISNDMINYKGFAMPKRIYNINLTPVWEENNNDAADTQRTDDSE